MGRSSTFVLSSNWVLAALLAVSAVAAASALETEHTLVYYQHFGEGGLVFGPAKDLGTTSSFGSGTVFDDNVTKGPGESTKSLGRARGLYFYNSLDEETNSNEQVFTIAFGKNSDYQGSTLVFQGVWIVQKDGKVDQELSIVGGTGQFRFAQGYAIYQRVDSDSYKVTAHIRCQAPNFPRF